MTLNEHFNWIEEARKLEAWSRANPSTFGTDYRIDCDHRLIKWDQFGKLTDYGWEVDHIFPTALGGCDNYSNIRARHWRGNRSAGGLLGGLLR